MNTNYYKVAFSLKIVSGVTVLVLCTLSNYDLHLYQVSRNILNGFRVIEQTEFSLLIIIMRHNSVNIVRSVTVLVLCT